MAKKALLVGINYPGTSNELRGCVNDVNAVKTVLQNIYKFDNITMLTDNEATTANMLSELETLVANPAPGDVLYFHYSGHGSQMYDNWDDDYEPDGLDEIICPVDLDWNTKVIRDDDLKRIFDKVPNGVSLTVTLDCCNSGGALDQENQYQSLGDARTEGKAGRFMPIPEDMAAPQLKLMEGKVKPRALQSPRDVDNTGLLISGCQSHQTSADAYINGTYMGACTYALLKLLSDYNYDLSYKQLIDKMNIFMSVQGYSQRPELNGSETLFDHKFLESSTAGSVVSESTIIISNDSEELFTPADEAMEVETEESVTPDPIVEPENNTYKWIGGILIIAAILLAAGVFTG